VTFVKYLGPRRETSWPFGGKVGPLPQSPVVRAKSLFHSATLRGGQICAPAWKVAATPGNAFTLDEVGWISSNRTDGFIIGCIETEKKCLQFRDLEPAARSCTTDLALVLKNVFYFKVFVKTSTVFVVIFVKAMHFERCI